MDVLGEKQYSYFEAFGQLKKGQAMRRKLWPLDVFIFNYPTSKNVNHLVVKVIGQAINENWQPTKQDLAARDWVRSKY